MAGECSPTSNPIILVTFPPAKRGAAFGVAAIATIVAPVLGPTLGGYITDTTSWRWIFFLNVPVGMVSAVFLVSVVVEDPPWEKNKKKRGMDFIGLSLITLGLGCLEVMMDRGEDAGWFELNFIRLMALLAFLGILGVIGWLTIAKKPIVHLSVFGDRNFAAGCAMISAMGRNPLRERRDHSAIRAASAILHRDLGRTDFSPGGVAVICLIPFVGIMMKRVQTRYLIAFGFVIMGLALLWSSKLTPDIDFTTLMLMRMSQTAALAFMFVPITTVTFLTLPRELNGDGTALFAMFRNVFGSIGISLATAQVTQRWQLDQTPTNNSCAYRRQTGLVDFDMQRKILVERTAGVEDQLRGNEVALAAGKRELDACRELMAATPRMSLTEESSGHTHTAADGMREQLYGLQLTQEGLRAKLTDEHPLMKEAAQQAAQARQVVDREPDKKLVKYGTNSIYELLASKSVQGRVDVAVAELKSTKLREQFQTARTELASLLDQQAKCARTSNGLWPWPTTSIACSRTITSKSGSTVR